MSSERLPPAIDLTFVRSRKLALLLALAYALAIAAVFITGLPWAARIAVAICLAAFAIWRMSVQALMLSPHAVRRVVWQPEGECEWQERGGRFHRGEMLPGLLVTPALVVFRVRVGRWRQKTFCIAADAVSDEAMRRLLTRLRVAPPRGRSSASRRLKSVFAKRAGSRPPSDEERSSASS